jgi:hypothetical protein
MLVPSFAFHSSTWSNNPQWRRFPITVDKQQTIHEYEYSVFRRRKAIVTLLKSHNARRGARRAQRRKFSRPSFDKFSQPLPISHV